MTTSPYAEVLDATRESLTTRAAHYRWLVIACALLCAVAVSAALVFRQWTWLLAMLLLPAAVMAFFAADTLAVQFWCLSVLERWCRHELQLDTLAKMLRQAPGLPSESLEGMIGALPRGVDSAPDAVRPLLSLAQAMAAQTVAEWFLGRAVAWMLGLTVLCAALMAHAVAGLAMLPAALVPPLLLRVLHGRRAKDACDEAAATFNSAGIASSEGFSLLNQLDWRGVSLSIRRAWLTPPQSPEAPRISARMSCPAAQPRE